MDFPMERTKSSNGFGNSDLNMLRTKKASVAMRTPTRVIPNATGFPHGGDGVISAQV